ncbi:MAG: ferrochelatase [Parvibaculum sp.]|uniref:ferrochelatase n=1 Tax=Parvibaculum sp. TaxID=2024848 RepID=UPI003C79709F
MTEPRRKIAVVLFNLGGPDGPDAVEPFLFNLFNDPAIIRVPQPLRWLIAKLVSRRRAPVAQEIYAKLGGGSPLVPLTERQARALEDALSGEFEARAFIAMRYWKPFAGDAARAVKAWAPDEIVLLPLYPQYSTTTTASSLKDWKRAAKAAGLSAPSRTICCYPLAEGFIAAHARLLGEALGSFGPGGAPRVLFSAHGLPKRVVEAGDPYQRQVEESCRAIVAALGIEGLDWVTCYQSRVGPLEWIGPATDAEIERAGREGRSLVVVPVAFVSEHSETLVELDIEYRHLAERAGVPCYVRVAALGTEPGFIGALAQLVREAQSHEGVYCPEEAAGRPCGEEG